jgi:tetraprenyl-beta-curcumene synthase
MDGLRRCGRLGFGPGRALGLLRLGVVYWLRINRQARQELAVWERRARRIPDPALRGLALRKLTGEGLNPEAAALFAVLAPRRRRERVVSLIVAYQVLYDYLDALNEEPGCEALRNGLQLHAAMCDALLPGRAPCDYYRHHGRVCDGGYMRELVSACQCLVGEFSSLRRNAAVLTSAAQRCGEAQSHNHAMQVAGPAGLIEWSASLGAVGEGYRWWELAAGGISCLGIHALLAAAADPRFGARDARRIDAAYFPSVCALSALLDSLADYHSDVGSPNHRFVAHYRDGCQAAERLVAIACEAAARLEGVRHRSRHLVILSGIVAYYLSCPGVWRGLPRSAAERLTAWMGWTGGIILGVMRARRRAHERNLSGRSM